MLRCSLVNLVVSIRDYGRCARTAAVLALLGTVLPPASLAQGAPAPSLGARLGLNTFVSPTFVLNLDVQVSASDGAPLKSLAVVTLYAQSGLLISTATTKGTHASFTQLAPGQYYVEVEAPGFWKTREDAMVRPAVTDNMVLVVLTPATTGMAPSLSSRTLLLSPEVQK